ncbi:MAG: tRNA preQ1(34) S-adenosylmethionine ribosyltransferase-isomerase QueA [Candidatus Omnitrophica bacterium]|nr:tRNA preQ1(34) S-adenosylmethionine ribosyltransferase-isomerase QueA [Candidatus Omnitrophota bacterium]
MKLSDFDYVLPKELIAQYPLKERDSARLLVLNRKKGTVEHRIFRDIVDYLGKDDLLVLNNTKVLPSRLTGLRKTGGKVEILLLNQKSGLTFQALIKPARVKIKEKIMLNSGHITAEVSDKNEITFYGIDINTIYKLGKMPLPPYIKREAQDDDNVYYQTVYARREGAIASPTAGLHFTEELLKKIKLSGTNIAYITLHISYSTFRPVKSQDITKHNMDKEYFHIGLEAIDSIERARSDSRRIFAVGTTSARTLESYSLGMKEGHTDLFIYPGYKFKIVDCLLTNFHLPRTTLFMLTCAFAQDELLKRAYQEAIDRKYRFYSYGDAMLII